MSRAANLFTKMLRAPRKEYINRGVTLPYADYRVLLGELDKRVRGGHSICWDFKNDHGEKMWMRMRGGPKKERRDIELPVPTLVQLAREDPPALHAYLLTCEKMLPFGELPKPKEKPDDN